MTESIRLVCTSCEQSYPLAGPDWCCTCGGLFDFETWPAFDASEIDTQAAGLWRYRRLLPLDPNWEPVTLGEGNTPLLSAEWLGGEVFLKLESVCPTGSVKDRGASVLVTALRGLGIKKVVEDSLGNAGASLAAYCARAGITCEICVPHGVAGPKLAQMRAYGAEVIEIKGKREYASLAAWAAAAHGAFYASHVYSPLFLAGVGTVAYELWEQLGRRSPEAVLVPAGSGTLLLGLYQGFRRLIETGLATQMPKLFAVQAAACGPIYAAYRSGQEDVEPCQAEPTVATGIAIGQPARGSLMLAVVRASHGAVLSVTEEQIIEASRLLARNGFWVEGTGAVAMAGLASASGAVRSASGEPIAVLLTGYGLKTHHNV
jgi:threonine synthase